MSLSEFLQNFDLPLYPAVLRILFLAAGMFGLYLIRKKSRDQQENMICTVLLGLWVLWHPVYGIACLFKFVFPGAAVDFQWCCAIYRNSFAFLGWLTLAGAVFCALPRKVRPWLILGGALLIWSVVCTLIAGNWQDQWSGTSYRMDGLRSYLFFAAVFLCAFRVKEGRLNLLRLFAWAANFEALLIVLQMVGVVPAFNDTREMGAGTFFNTNHCAYCLTMAILSNLGLYFYDGGKRCGWAYLLSFGLQYPALLMNNTFGCVIAVWIGFIAAYVLLCIRGEMQKKDFLPIIVLIAGSLGQGSVIFENFRNLFGDVSDIIEDPGSEVSGSAGSGRIRLWRATLKYIGQKPLFGWGPEGIHDLLSTEFGNDRPHNEYLQYAAFLGIPGLALYLGGLITLCVERLKYLRTLDAVTITAGGAVIGYLISAFFGNTMFYTTPLFFLLLGLVASDNEEKETELCSIQTPV